MSRLAMRKIIGFRTSSPLGALRAAGTRMRARFPFLLALGVLSLAGLLSGCGPVSSEERGLTLQRITPGSLPLELKNWFEERRDILGAYSTRGVDRTYLLVSWGEKPTGGYQIRMEKVAENQTEVVIIVRLTRPEPGQVMTQTLTRPYDLASIPVRRGKEIIFSYVGEGILSDSRKLTSTLSRPREEEPKTLSGVEGTSEGKYETGVQNRVSDHDEVKAAAGNFRLYEPAPGSLISNPLRLRGQARVFEATFGVELEDGHQLLADKVVTADNGAPSWGNFDLELEFESPTSPHGTLIFIVYSAEDGSRQEELVVPVRFQE